MCLAVPAKIVEINGETAILDMEGVRREGIISLINDPRPGDYVLLHAGFAIRKWSEADVREWREIMEEAGALEQ
jgi:hydrogenase expression/formation protein HypC